MFHKGKRERGKTTRTIRSPTGLHLITVSSNVYNYYLASLQYQVNTVMFTREQLKFFTDTLHGVFCPRSDKVMQASGLFIVYVVLEFQLPVVSANS